MTEYLTTVKPKLEEENLPQSHCLLTTWRCDRLGPNRPSDGTVSHTHTHTHTHTHIMGTKLQGAEPFLRIPCHLWNSNVHCHVHRSSPLVTTLNKMKLYEFLIFPICGTCPGQRGTLGLLRSRCYFDQANQFLHCAANLYNWSDMLAWKQSVNFCSAHALYAWWFFFNFHVCVLEILIFKACNVSLHSTSGWIKWTVK
jgi:hypothetical protein